MFDKEPEEVAEHWMKLLREIDENEWANEISQVIGDKIDAKVQYEICAGKVIPSRDQMDIIDRALELVREKHTQAPADREAIKSERHKVYGDVVENHENIACAWVGLLRDHAKSIEMGIPLPTWTVALMMATLKIDRMRLIYHKDNYDDAHNYLDFADDMQAEDQKRRDRLSKAKPLVDEVFGYDVKTEFSKAYSMMTHFVPVDRHEEKPALPDDFHAEWDALRSKIIQYGWNSKVSAVIGNVIPFEKILNFFAGKQLPTLDEFTIIDESLRQVERERDEFEKSSLNQEISHDTT